MLSLGFFYVLALIAITVVSAVAFKRSGYLAVAVKGALGSLGGLLTICFVYGLFNRFSLWHGASPPGVESGIAYALIWGIFAGPIVFIVGGVAAVAIVRIRKSKK